MEKAFRDILSYMRDESCYDFTGCSHDMLKRRIKMRFVPSKSRNFSEYYAYLKDHSEESEALMKSITIKVSHFFRNPLDFEIISKVIGQIIQKNHEQSKPFRVWSAGCATGEEPYSIAILTMQNLYDQLIETDIIATDIDPDTIEKAKLGIYSKESIEEVKFGFLEKYFISENERYKLTDQIRKMVDFSVYDLLSMNTTFPPASVYGGFDLVLCRNVLIYYNKKYQNIIFSKLYNSLNQGAYLMLGEAENIIDNYREKLIKIAPHSKIYRKIG